MLAVISPATSPASRLPVACRSPADRELPPKSARDSKPLGLLVTQTWERQWAKSQRGVRGIHARSNHSKHSRSRESRAHTNPVAILDCSAALTATNHSGHGRRCTGQQRAPTAVLWQEMPGVEPLQRRARLLLRLACLAHARRRSAFARPQCVSRGEAGNTARGSVTCSQLPRACSLRWGAPPLREPWRLPQATCTACAAGDPAGRAPATPCAPGRADAPTRARRALRRRRPETESHRQPHRGAPTTCRRR